jgi:hypothetical protein
VANVETLEHPVPVVVLLLLLLLDGDEALSYFFLPLGVLSFLDGGEPGVKTSVLHMLLMVSRGQWMMAHMMIMCTCGVVVEATSREGHASP